MASDPWLPDVPSYKINEAIDSTWYGLKVSVLLLDGVVIMMAFFLPSRLIILREMFYTR